MLPYRVSPYVYVVENRLIPNVIQYGAAHLLTGEVIEMSERMRTVFSSLDAAKPLWLREEDLNFQPDAFSQLRLWVEKEFLIPFGHDPLSTFVSKYPVRPIQNPALVYTGEDGRVFVVHTSMTEHAFSPGRNQMPSVIEESLPPVAASIYLQADGTKTLREIYESSGARPGANMLEDASFREALDFLTDRSRQLIKFAPSREDMEDPYRPFNIVPRDLYHSERWGDQQAGPPAKTVKDFHLEGIEDALWEFDVIEPTLNHALRFPSEVLGGMDYGSRFFLSTMRSEIFLPEGRDRVKVLEVGGGTGTFARSFLEQALKDGAALLKGALIDYHILELSPTLAESQKRVLSEAGHEVTHFHQDATEFDLPGRSFELIISNEVIADFPVASVLRVGGGAAATGADASDNQSEWGGPGAYYVEKYDLPVEDAPESFVVNAGVFQFLERAWLHLAPGGAMVLTEYGSEHAYPALSFNLNHEEYSIHFGHVAACARKIGFDCRLLKLNEFLDADADVLMLNGKEEHILCLNHVLERFGERVPYALVSKKEFYERFGKILGEVGLTGVTFSPLRAGFHFGPNLMDFMALVLNKPR